MTVSADTLRDEVNSMWIVAQTIDETSPAAYQRAVRTVAERHGIHPYALHRTLEGREPVSVEVGCYLDGARGHYITRDVVELACDYGFIVGPFERFVVDRYELYCEIDDYPHEALSELADEARDWLNHDGDDQPFFQNYPPARPEGAYWDWRDGDFGLWLEEEEDDDLPCGGTGW